VSGNNTVSFKQAGKWHTVAGFTARPGYDLASGVGTVNAALFVPELACLARHVPGGRIGQLTALGPAPCLNR